MMINLNINFQKVLIITCVSMVLSLIIVSSTSVTYIKIIENQNSQFRNSQGLDSLDQSNGEAEAAFAEKLKAGNVGESGEAGNGSTQNTQLMPMIFSTSGVITEVKSDRLLLNGDGSNFADAKPRALTVIYAPETTTFVSGINYMGLDGLKKLKTGDKVLVEGAENIRGKTEFSAGNINAAQ